MPGSTSLLAFVAASLVVLLIPGPGVLYIVARSLSQGRRAGLVSVLGLSVGALVHVAAATLGLSAILLTSATAFGVVKALGAAYLIYLGISTAIRAPSKGTAWTPPTVCSSSRLFTDGVVVSILNPKIAVFLSRFSCRSSSSRALGPIPQQVLFLGLLYVALALFTDGAYAFLAGGLRHWLGGRVMKGPLPRYASGFVYLGLGVSMALADRRL